MDSQPTHLVLSSTVQSQLEKAQDSGKLVEYFFYYYCLLFLVFLSSKRYVEKVAEENGDRISRKSSVSERENSNDRVRLSDLRFPRVSCVSLFKAVHVWRGNCKVMSFSSSIQNAAFKFHFS